MFYTTIIVGFDYLRVMVGPLPFWFCHLKVVFKGVFFMIFGITLSTIVIHRTLDFGIGRTDTDTRKVSAEPIPIPIPKPIRLIGDISDIFTDLYFF